FDRSAAPAGRLDEPAARSRLFARTRARVAMARVSALQARGLDARAGAIRRRARRAASRRDLAARLVRRRGLAAEAAGGTPRAGSPADAPRDLDVHDDWPRGGAQSLPASSRDSLPARFLRRRAAFSRPIRPPARRHRRVRVLAELPVERAPPRRARRGA